MVSSSCGASHWHTPLLPEAQSWGFPNWISALQGAQGHWDQCAVRGLQEARLRACWPRHHFSLSTVPFWSTRQPQSLGSVYLMKSAVEITTPFSVWAITAFMMCLNDKLVFGNLESHPVWNSCNLSFSSFCHTECQYLCQNLPDPL